MASPGQRRDADAGPPSHGFLRIYREGTAHDSDGDGVMEYDQVGQFTGLPYVQELDPPAGDWEMHNTEVNRDVAYSSWYSHGIVAPDLADPAALAYVQRWGRGRDTAGPRVATRRSEPEEVLVAR